MKNKTNIKLPLTDIEKANLRKHKIKIANILDFATDKLENILNATVNRAKEIYALAEFQTVPTGFWDKVCRRSCILRVLFTQGTKAQKTVLT